MLKIIAILLVSSTLALTKVHAQVPTPDNNQLLSEITLFAELVNNGEMTAAEFRKLVDRVHSDESLSYESKVQIETHLLTAYKSAGDEPRVNVEVAQATMIARNGIVAQNPSLVASMTDRPLIIDTPPPVATQNIPFTPYPGYLGFNYKDPLEFCDVTSLADQVLNTNYRDLNLQLRQRFKNKTLDELAELIIHQRAMDMASYATMTSAAALGTSWAAHYLPQAVGGAGRGATLTGGQITVVTGAAVVATTLLYLDICSYAQQNARMIFQLNDLYDTGAFYTTDEKQKRAWRILLASMAGKTVEKFTLEYQTTRTIGTLARDIYFSVLSRGGNFFRGIFEQVSYGIKSGLLQADAAKLPVVNDPIGIPGRPSPTPGVPSPSRPSFPPVPGVPGPGQPSQPGQAIELEIAKVSPWAILALPANGALTYYSMQAVGRNALMDIKSDFDEVYALPMKHEYAQEAIFKVLIYAGVATEAESNKDQTFAQQQMPVRPLNPVNPLNPGAPPSIPSQPGLPGQPGTQPQPVPSTPAPAPVAKTLRNTSMRNYIEMMYAKYNPEKGTNTALYEKIQAEMNDYNSAIPQDVTGIFNEELNNVPVKRALVRAVIEMLYQDKSFDYNDRKVLRVIQVNILGLQDPNFSDLIYRDLLEEEKRLN